MSMLFPLHSSWDPSHLKTNTANGERATEPASDIHTKLAYHDKAADCWLKQFPFLGAQLLAKGLKETSSYDSDLENLVSA